MNVYNTEVTGLPLYHSNLSFGFVTDSRAVTVFRMVDISTIRRKLRYGGGMPPRTRI